MTEEGGQKEPLLATPQAADGGGNVDGKKGSMVIQVPESLQGVAAQAQEGFAKTQEFLANQYVKAKAATTKSPWIISVIVVVASVGVVWCGIFAIIWKVVTLGAVQALLKVYQCVFATIVCILELSQYVDPFKVQRFVGKWAALLETAVGRGLLQLLPGSLAVVTWDSMAEYVPGLVLMGIGVVNVVYGVVTAWKLRRVMGELRDLEKQTLTTKSGKRISNGDISQIDLMAQKFKAMDVNGNGELTKEDLRQACVELNVTLTETDAEHVFSALDMGGKGHIDLKDFENWWFKSKGSELFV